VLVGIRISGDLRRQDFERDSPIQTRVACSVDFASPACIYGGLDLIRPEACPRIAHRCRPPRVPSPARSEIRLTRHPRRVRGNRGQTGGAPLLTASCTLPVGAFPERVIRHARVGGAARRACREPEQLVRRLGGKRHVHRQTSVALIASATVGGGLEGEVIGAFREGFDEC